MTLLGCANNTLCYGWTFKYLWKSVKKLYSLAANKLRTMGYEAGSEGEILTSAARVLGGGPTNPRSLLEAFIAAAPPKLVKGAYQMPLALKIAARRAEKEQVTIITIGGRNV